MSGKSFASAGMTARTCEKEGFHYVTASTVAPDRHPGMLPGANQLKVKLIFSDRSGILLGGQLSSGPSVDELINARTAGFSTLNMGTMANETLFIQCILMFIGQLGPMVIGIAVSRKRIDRFHLAERRFIGFSTLRESRSASDPALPRDRN